MSKKKSTRRPRRPAGTQGEPSSREGRRDFLWAAGLTLLAWFHRLAFLCSNRDWDWPFTIFYEGDAEAFYRTARALLAGELYDNGIPFHPPGFPLVLAVVHSLVGAGGPNALVPHAVVKAILALVGSLSIGLLYLLVRPYLGRTAALLAALLGLYHFGLYVLSIAPVSEGLYLFLLLLALLVWSRRLGYPLAVPVPHPGGLRGGRRWALLLGLLLGALCLTRAEGMLVAALLVGVGLAGSLGKRTLPERAPLRRWALVALGWVLVVGPWTLRNFVEIRAFETRQEGRLAEPLPKLVPVTIYAPLNLALANWDGADGTFSRRLLASRSPAPTLDLADPEHLRLVLHGNTVAADWIFGHPGDYARLLGKKWAIYLRAWELGWTQWDWPGGLSGERLPVDVFVPEALASRQLPWVTWSLAVVGLLACLRTPGGPRRWAFVVLLLFAAGLATTALFFGYVRQGLLFLPFGFTLVAVGAVTLADLVRALIRRTGSSWRVGLTPTDPSRPLLAALGVAALVLLGLEAWGMGAHRNYKATGSTVAGERFLNRDDRVFLEPIP